MRSVVNGRTRYKVTVMTLQIELNPEKERILREEAARRGVSVEQCAKALLEESLPSGQNGNLLTPDEEERLLDELAARGDGLPILPPEANSREWIYRDHD